MQKREEKLQDVPKKIKSSFHIEVDRVKDGISLTVSGVLSVLNINENEIILKLAHEKIKISGAELNIAIYENKTVEIIGRIGAVEFK